MHLAARVTTILVAAALASCGRAAQTGSPAQAPSQQASSTPLAQFLTLRLVVTPTGYVRADSLGWVQRLGGPRVAGRQLDSALAGALSDRGIGRSWFLPADLVRSYDRNRTYAPNPYDLALDPLRPASFQATSRYAEPLASQLRTMVALHESARLVLAPVELKFVTDAAGTRAALRVAILDTRFAEARWVGEIRGDASAGPERALASVASRFADLWVAP